MYKNKKIMALIPARGGSKGLPRKNIMALSGKPLIAWTIDQIKDSKYIDRFIVSTDDEEIAEISKRYKAEVPFKRPAKLATDGSSSVDTVLHALDWLREKGQRFDYIALLEPTSPLREAVDIDRAIELLIDHKDAKSIVSVSKLEATHPEFNVVIDKDSGFISKAFGGSEFSGFRRQDINDIYFFDGTIYIAEAEAFLERKTFFHDLTLAYIVPRWKSLEIDELPDLICAEALLEARSKKLLK